MYKIVTNTFTIHTSHTHTLTHIITLNFHVKRTITFCECLSSPHAHAHRRVTFASLSDLDLCVWWIENCTLYIHKCVWIRKTSINWCRHIDNAITFVENGRKATLKISSLCEIKTTNKHFVCVQWNALKNCLVINKIKCEKNLSKIMNLLLINWIV